MPIRDFGPISEVPDLEDGLDVCVVAVRTDGAADDVTRSIPVCVCVSENEDSAHVSPFVLVVYQRVPSGARVSNELSSRVAPNATVQPLWKLNGIRTRK